MQFHCTKMLFSWANKYSIEPDLICNKIADKITKNDDANSEIGVPKKIHISRRKTTNYWWIKVSITI